MRAVGTECERQQLCSAELVLRLTEDIWAWLNCHWLSGMMYVWGRKPCENWSEDGSRWRPPMLPQCILWRAEWRPPGGPQGVLHNVRINTVKHHVGGAPIRSQYGIMRHLLGAADRHLSNKVISPQNTKVNLVVAREHYSGGHRHYY